MDHTYYWPEFVSLRLQKFGLLDESVLFELSRTGPTLIRTGPTLSFKYINVAQIKSSNSIYTYGRRGK